MACGGPGAPPQLLVGRRTAGGGVQVGRNSMVTAVGHRKPLYPYTLYRMQVSIT